MRDQGAHGVREGVQAGVNYSGILNGGFDIWMRVEPKGERRDDNRTRTERLVKVLQIQNIPHFQERMAQIVRRKVEFLASKSEVEKGTHLELLYIAKIRPDAYRAPGVISYLVSVVEGEKIPKALLPTLFMIYGKVYLHDPYPPVIMAKILYRDVVGTQDICMWARADVRGFVSRVQLTYFFEPTILSKAAKGVLCKYSQPNAVEAPANFASYDGKADGGEVAKLHRLIDENVKKIEARRFDRDAFECLVSFLQMPVPRRIFLEQFTTLATEFPHLIPRILGSVQFFLNYAEPSDQRSAEFLRRLCSLNSSAFPEEMKQTLSSIAAMSSVYWTIVVNTRLMNTGTDVSNYSLERKLLTMDYRQPQEVERLKQCFREWQPSFSNAYELLTLVLQEARKMSDQLTSVFVIFKVVLMFTQFDSQLEKFADLVAAYLIFLRDYGGVSFGDYACQSEGIICPRNCAQTGVPFRTDGFSRLVENPVSLPLAYSMLCAAAKYQIKTDGLAVYGGDYERVARLVLSLTMQPVPKVCIQGWILACLLLIVSPTGIGEEIYRNEDSKKLFTEFIARVLVGGTLEKLRLEWAESQVGTLDMFSIIMAYAELKILSRNHILACYKPAYLEDVILFADITDPPPAWLKHVSEDRMEKAPNHVVVKYIVLRLTEALSEANGVPLRRFYETPFVKKWMDILFQRHMKREETSDLCKVYAPLLAHNSRVVRSAIYVLNTMINAEPSYSQDESYTLTPLFELPPSDDLANLLAKVLYMENDCEALSSFVDYLAKNDKSDSVLQNFAQKRPLLCNSLNHKALASMMATQYQTVDMSKLMSINFSMPNYSILQEDSRAVEVSQAYHTLPLPATVHVDIDSLPIYEPLPPKQTTTSNELTMCSIAKVSRTDEEIYRCQIALHRDNQSRFTKLFTLSILKRVIAREPKAFMIYAEPELHVLSREYEHLSVISDKLKTSLLYFLVICMYRRERVPRQFTEAEALFFEELQTRLQSMDMSKLEGDQMVSDLRNHLIGSETESSKLSSRIVPASMPWSVFVSHNHLFRDFITSLELSEPEYADQWVTKLCLYPQDVVGRPDLRDQVILPLLMSSSKDSISAFLSLGSEVDCSTDNNPYQQIRQTIHEQISSLYPPVTVKP